MSHNTKHISTSKGNTLAVYDWLYVRRDKPRAAILIAHTLGDYAERHEHMAKRFLNWGFMVRAFDFYGHGNSSGTKGTTPSHDQFLHDIGAVVADWRQTLPAGLPIVIWGFSFGANVAANAQIKGLMDADAYCLISPTLELNVKPIQRFMLYLMQRIIPNRLGSNHYYPEDHSRDPDVQLLLAHDPRIVRVLSLRIAETVFNITSTLKAEAENWSKPTLLLYNSQDRAIVIRATDEFIARSKNNVEAKKFEDMGLDLFNDLGKEQVYTRFQQWLDKLYPPK